MEFEDTRRYFQFGMYGRQVFLYKITYVNMFLKKKKFLKFSSKEQVCMVSTWLGKSGRHTAYLQYEI